MLTPARVLDRATTNVERGESGCLLSLYSTGSHGYAQVGWRDSGKTRTVLAHRAAWEAAHGAIPEGMTVDHLCKRRRCVAVDHLRLLSNFENARRTSGRDWPEGQCVNGHPNSELVRRGPKRACRVCSNEWQRRYRAKRRVA